MSIHLSSVLESSPKSPKAIPPRTSSTQQAAPTNRTMLTALPETNWLAPAHGHTQHHHHSSPAAMTGTRARGQSASTETALEIPARNKSRQHPAATADADPPHSSPLHGSPGGRSGTQARPRRRLSSTSTSSPSPSPQPVQNGQQQQQQHDLAPLRAAADAIIGQRNPPWSAEKEGILRAPYDYLLGHPGKDIRARCIIAFNAFLQVPERSLEVIRRVVGMLHTASLLIDDVEDSSHMRRGVPVAHNIFGTAQTINSSNYVYFLALQELARLRNGRAAIAIYTEELLNLHRGQGMDLYWRDSLTCPSEADYLEMVNNKTGGLFRLAVKLMQTESSTDIDCVPLVNTIGLLFQILDDYQNLQAPAYHAAKGQQYEDLTEGKFSFPVVHAMRADRATALILESVLRQRTADPAVKRYAVEHMDRLGTFAYTRAVLRHLAARAEEHVLLLERQLDAARPGVPSAAPSAASRVAPQAATGVAPQAATGTALQAATGVAPQAATEGRAASEGRAAPEGTTEASSQTSRAGDGVRQVLAKLNVDINPSAA